MSDLTHSSARPKASPFTTKPAAPVLWLATVGAIVILVMAYCAFQWFSFNLKPAPIGTDIAPRWLLIWGLCLQAGFTAAAAVFAWLYIVKPLITERRLSWDGMFMLACFTIWLQDPMDNYFNFSFSYNALLVNRSSWAPYIPGWGSPRGENFAEPIFMMGGLFFFMFFAMSLIGCAFLRKSKQWFPNQSFAVHLLMLFVLFFFLDLVFESLLCRTGIFAYGGTYAPLTLWAGEFYQFPLYESTGIATVCLGMTLIRYSRNDRGQSFAERGVDSLRLSSGTKKLLTWLALVGANHVIVFIGFFMPYIWFSLKADSYPQLPSYMRMEICGQGTPYACPSREVPIPSRTSLAIPPDDPRLTRDARKN